MSQEVYRPNGYDYRYVTGRPFLRCTVIWHLICADPGHYTWEPLREEDISSDPETLRTVTENSRVH